MHDPLRDFLSVVTIDLSVRRVLCWLLMRYDDPRVSITKAPVHDSQLLSQVSVI